MNNQRIVGCALMIAFLVLPALSSAFAQNGESDRVDREDRKRQVNARQLEMQLHQIMQQRERIQAAISKSGGKEKAETRKLLAQLKSLDNKKAAIQEYAKKRMRESDVRRTREQARERASRQREQAREKENRNRNAGREQRRERDTDRFQQARNRLEHMHAAMEHLHAAGLTEIKQTVAKRAEGLERELKQAEENREHAEEVRKRAEEKERAAQNLAEYKRRQLASQMKKAQRERELRADGDEEFHREVFGAIRELSAAIRSLRKEMAELKRDDDD